MGHSYGRPVLYSFSALNARPFRVFECQLKLTRQRVDCRSGALPHTLALESYISDTTTPRRYHAANCPIIAPVRMLLVESSNDVGRHADKGTQRGRRLDAVLATVPGDAEYDRDL